MPIDASHEVTQLLLAWNDGDQTALDRLIPPVHAELRRIARRLRNERAGHTLQTSALINEAYLRLIGHLLRQPGCLCFLELLGSFERPVAFRPPLTRGLAFLQNRQFRTNSTSGSRCQFSPKEPNALSSKTETTGQTEGTPRA